MAKGIGKFVANVAICAKKVAETNVNQACFWWTFQDKIPDSVQKKLKK